MSATIHDQMAYTFQLSWLFHLIRSVSKATRNISKFYIVPWALTFFQDALAVQGLCHPWSAGHLTPASIHLLFLL